MLDKADHSSQSPGETRVILGFVSDLFFGSRIESVARALDFQVIWFAQDNPTDLLVSGRPVLHPGGHPSGSDFTLLEKITRLQPDLIILDLGDTVFPWQEWLAIIKKSPATRRIPVIGFGPHVESEKLKAARSAGADIVLARSAFARELPQVLLRAARMPDIPAISSSCMERLSAVAIRGLDEFNRGEYFEAHEFLEEAWNQELSVGRELYRAILQVAVAYLQIERNNYRGAMKMLLRVRQWINPLPDTCRGVDIARLRADVELVHAELIKLGGSGIRDFDRSLLKPVLYEP